MRILIIGFLCLISFHTYGQLPISLQPGDFLFADLQCGPLCDAINAVTDGVDGVDFNHVGMVVPSGDSLVIVEAIGKAVTLTPLHKFRARTTSKIWQARLIPSKQWLIPGAVAFAMAQSGKPYDDAFLPENGKYYCSELLFDAFKAADPDHPIFSLSPMTYCIPGSKAFFPAWVAYFKTLNIRIPEGLPGCNPGGMSRSPALHVVGWL